MGCDGFVVFSFCGGFGCELWIVFLYQGVVVLLYVTGSMPPRGSTARLARFLCGRRVCEFLVEWKVPLAALLLTRCIFFCLIDELSHVTASSSFKPRFWMYRMKVVLHHESCCSSPGYSQFRGLSNASSWSQPGCLLRTISCQNPTIWWVGSQTCGNSGF